MKIKINNNYFTFSKDETILQVAQKNNIYIPTLCFFSKPSQLVSQSIIISAGNCRICVVEIVDKSKKAKTFIDTPSLVTSCNTPAKDGMEIITESKRIFNARKTVIDLILSSGKHDCLTCEKNGDCKLQNLAYEYGIEKPSFSENIIENPIDNSSEFIRLDRSKCINCGICVNLCNSVVNNNVLAISERGLQTKIIFDNDTEIGKSSCVQCGECSQACPTGALTDKCRIGKGQIWNLKQIKTICPYCGVGCGIIVHLNKYNNQIAFITGDENNPVNNGSLCVKGRYAFDFITHPDRLTKPLKKIENRFVEISWQQALAEIALKLKSFNPVKIAGFSSAKITNEENYLFQKFFRKYLKSNNIDHCARLCHSSTVSGLSKTLGSGAMTNNIQDIFNAKMIFVIGSNTSETHPVISYYIKQAVKFNKCKLIVIDPRRVDIAKYADIYLQLLPGTDVAFINSIMYCIINNKKFTNKAKRFKGYEDLVTEVIKLKYKPENIGRICGIDSTTIYQIADFFVTYLPTKVFFAMGITQHSNGTDNVMALSNLQLLTGNIGRKGGGINPLRGQVNVQGACDMGCLPNVLPGYQKLTDNQSRKKFEQVWNCKLDKKPGLTITEAFEKAAKNEMDAFFVIGENPIISEPNQAHTIKALQNLKLLIVQDIFMTETAQYADYVLPALSYAEKEGHFTNTERFVQRVNKIYDKPFAENSQAHSDSYIIQMLMQEYDKDYIFMNNNDICSEINLLIPQYQGITWSRTRNKGLYWPCKSISHQGTKILYKDESINNCKFVTVRYKGASEKTNSEYPLILTTGRLLYHFHSCSMTGKTEGLNNLGKAFVMISIKDAIKYNITHNSIIKVSNVRGSITITARISKRIKAGVIFIPFHFAESCANILTNNVYDKISKIPEYKVCSAKIEQYKK